MHFLRAPASLWKIPTSCPTSSHQDTSTHSAGTPCSRSALRSARARRISIGQTVAVRSDLWRVIHAERAALVDDLAVLDPAQWATPSLCDGWDVHDVVAHLAATAALSLSGFAKECLLAGFSSGRIVDKQVAAGRPCKPSETLSALRSAVSSTASAADHHKDHRNHRPRRRHPTATAHHARLLNDPYRRSARLSDPGWQLGSQSAPRRPAPTRH
jgi:hypothetical protein